jgi:hypothetical protein
MGDDLLRFDIESFLRWMNAVRRPFCTIEEFLADTDEKKQLAGAFQLWITSATLSTAVSLVMSVLVVGEKTEIKDALYYFAFGMLLFLLTVFILHLCLRLFGIGSVFSKTAVLQSVIVCYSPMTAVFLVPWLLKSSRSVSEGSLGSNVYEGLLYNVFRYDSLPGLRYLGWCFPLLSTILCALLVEAICNVYNATRMRTQLALITGGFLSTMVPMLLYFAVR